MDSDEQKEKQITDISKKSSFIHFIVSNPCIEVWFLMHFVYSTHQFKNSKEPKRELRKYIYGYEENTEVVRILYPHLHMALENANKLKIYYDQMGEKWTTVRCNPMSDIPEIIYELDVL